MVFDITIILGDANEPLEYDKDGNIIESQNWNTFPSYSIPDQKCRKITIVKDPINDHINIYALELYDLPKDIMVAFESNRIFAILIRIGSKMEGNLKVFDLFHIYIRPITIITHAMQQDLMVNDLIVKGISLTANAMLQDASFAMNLDAANPDSELVAISVGDSVSLGEEYENSMVKANAKRTVLSSIYNNPGNLNKSNNKWAGETQNNSRYESFKTPEYGVRANIRNIMTKIINNPTWTLGDVIEKLTPANVDGNPANYAHNVSKMSGVPLQEPLKKTDVLKVLKAISWYEGDNVDQLFSKELFNKVGGLVEKEYGIVFDRVLFDNPSYAYGNNVAPVTGTNVNQPIDTFKNIKGKTLLDTIINRLKEKFHIEVDTSASASLYTSTFLYPKVALPSLNAIDTLLYINKYYPSYLNNTPWIIDDMKSSDGMDNLLTIGKSWYIELNLLAPNKIPFSNLWANTFNGDVSILSEFFRVKSIKSFFDTNRNKIDATTFIYKELPTGIITTFNGTSTSETTMVPSIVSKNTNSVNLQKLEIKTNQIINEENNYTAAEFEKRLKLFKNQIYTNPQIIRCELKIDDPNLIQFGKAYSFGANMNKLTPLKIKMEFENIESQLRLIYEVDFYKGIDIEV